MDIPAPGAEGVLFAHGSRFGGHALYVKDNRLHYVYNFVGLVEQKVDGSEDLPVGENLILSASFEKDGEDPPGVSTGILSLYHGEEKVGEARIKTQPGLFTIAGEGLCVGRDSGEPVTDDYPGEHPHTSPAARSSASPSTSAATPTSISNARPRPCSPGSRAGLCRAPGPHDVRPAWICASWWCVARRAPGGLLLLARRTPGQRYGGVTAGLADLVFTPGG